MKNNIKNDLKDNMLKVFMVNCYDWSDSLPRQFLSAVTGFLKLWYAYNQR
jgi:hypothetical protein